MVSQPSDNENRHLRESQSVEREPSRQELEEELALFVAGPVVVFKWRNVPDHWPLEYVSSNVSELLGFEREALLDGTVPHFELVHADDFDRVVEELQSNSAAGHEYFRHRPYRLLRNDGSMVWVDNRTTIVRDPSGDITHYQGYIVDITQARAGEERLRQSQQMLSLVMDSIPVALCWKDLHSTYLGCNKLFAEVAGVNGSHEVVGLRDSDLNWLEEERIRAREADRRVTESNEAELFQMETGHHADGRKLMLETSRIPIQSEQGEAIGVLSLFRDITEQKMLEAQLEKAQRLESLGLLAGGVAHDFNNVLTTILGNADLLSHMLPEDLSSEPVDNIIRASENAADLAQQMLTFAGGQSSKKRILQLGELAREIAKLLRISVSKNTRIDLIQGKHVPPIEADAGQIRQVLMNLIINGDQAIGKLSGVVTVRTGTLYADRQLLKGTWVDDDLPSGQYSFVDVEDTGSGMSEETRAKLFEPFFTTKKEGRGLGMATVLGIVRHHRGAIKVVSEPGKGSCFRVLLPSAETAPAGRPMPDLAAL